MGVVGLGPGPRHRIIAAEFGDTVAAVKDWDLPTPVAGWVAGDVVAHLVHWLPAFLAAGGVQMPAGPDPATGPEAAWQAQSAGVQALLDGPLAHETFVHPLAGEHRLADAIDRFYTADVFMHTWDLATACGRSPALDPAFADQLVTGMAGMEAILRSSGQYGPAVPTAADADPITRLVGFIGRDPGWRAHA